MSVIIFLVVLCVLILVHEWGHFITAKRLGMRVDEFAIGFPPRLFAKKIGETIYSFNIFLIGGYVKILGENPEEAGAGTDPRSFSAKSKWAQTIVLLAGVTMNVILAWVLFVIVLMVGTQTAVSETERGADTPLLVTQVIPESPAADAGLPISAEVTNVTSGEDSLEDITPSTFQTFVGEHADEPIRITYEYRNEVGTVSITPEAGVLEGEGERAAVGVALGFIDTVSYPVHEAVIKATTMTVDTLVKITVGLLGLLWDAVQFKANLADVAGPVGIVGLVGEASAFGITTLLMFTAFISLNLAVINLLPFPALDGGRILFVVIEAIKGSPIKPSWAGTLNTIGFFLLILLMLAVTYNDIAKLVTAG